MVDSDAQRAFIQAFFSHRCLRFQEAANIWRNIISTESGQDEHTPDEVMLSTIIATLNSSLSHFDFEIRSMRDQKNRSSVYALVNTASDDIIQAATAYSPEQIAYFKRLLDAMFETNNTIHAEVFAVNATDAVNLNRPPRGVVDEEDEEMEAEGEEASGEKRAKDKGLTKQEAEETLAGFVEDGWLIKSRAGWYSLAPRALLELSLYLTSTYNDPSGSENESVASEDRPVRVKHCYACKELLTIGQRCDTLKCPVRMHTPCTEQYFRTVRDQKCPGCRREWSGEQKVGEGAAGKLRKRGGNGKAVRRMMNGRTNTGTRRNTRQRDGGSEDMEEVVEDEEDGDEE